MNLARDIVHLMRRATWYASRGRQTDYRLLRHYLCAHETRKLHIGCSAHLLNGWLNSDLFPSSREILHLDARKAFPINSDQFDYIFAEHMIEHIRYPAGAMMLAECYRVLRHSGKLRISTPNLRCLIDLYRKDKSSLQTRYLEWATQTHVPYAPYVDETFVINNFVRDWGHQFIYDEKTLIASLETAGFTNVVLRDLGSSEDESLLGLENGARMPAGFLEMETVTVEGTKEVRSQAIDAPNESSEGVRSRTLQLAASESSVSSTIRSPAQS